MIEVKAKATSKHKQETHQIVMQAPYGVQQYNILAMYENQMLLYIQNLTQVLGKEEYYPNLYLRRNKYPAILT